MKRAIVERNLVVVLFVLALVMFTFAQRDTRRATHHLITQAAQKAEKLLLAVTPRN